MHERIKEYNRDGLLKPNPPPFQNTAMQWATIRSGMRLSLLTETHIATTKKVAFDISGNRDIIEHKRGRSRRARAQSKACEKGRF